MSTQSSVSLPIDVLLDPNSPCRPTSQQLRLGTSRQGRDIFGYRLGQGPHHVSLIGGCHADEPVGPAMLDRLAAHLAELPSDAELLSRVTWYLVPHANPDGEARNAAWTTRAFDTTGALTNRLFDLGHYLLQVVRELPGDDVEFGFPRSADDRNTRPENLAIADFLRHGSPFVLHASFHGMAFAAGPWFLLEQAWIDRTHGLRERLRHRVRELGYRLHDIDRHGDKGFHRIDEGFTTRPDSRAMVAHFEADGDTATAALFRPSSMELVRSFGGDPLTLVSEMPLFLVPAQHFVGGDLIRPDIVRQLLMEHDADAIRALADLAGIEAMAIDDQMRLQLEYLQAALDASLAESG